MDSYTISMSVVFILGYLFIALEHFTAINKATVALLMAIICWILEFASSHFTPKAELAFLGEHVADISQVVFFLFGALAIVETINVHHGFNVISENISLVSKRKLLWVLGIIAFFLSSILDNLTTTIVMVSLLTKLVRDREDRLLIGGGVVIAANAGGAWTPIGDVTTTMLWIGGQVTTVNVITYLIIPSFVCFVASFLVLMFMLKGEISPLEGKEKERLKRHREPLNQTIFFLGIGLLMFVPVFKVITGLPPFMGMLFSLSILWLFTDIVHRNYDERQHLRLPRVLSRIDISSILFFLGILLCINALETAGILEMIAHLLDRYIANLDLIAIFIGIISAIVDNVPLVAASMGMYSLEHFPPDSPFWQLVAYCAGTGGSLLIIGSAAGVVFMGLESVDFFWYMKRITLPAAVGYFAGIAAYFLIF